MSKNKPTDVEAAEVAAIETATLTFDPDPHFARGDCRDAMLDVIRQAVDWSKFDEQRQRDINAAVDNAASTIVGKLVKGIAAEGRATVTGKLEQLTVKDGIVVKLTCAFTHDNLALLGDATSKTVQLVMADRAAFDHQRAPAHVDPDQPDLLNDGDDLVDSEDDQPDVSRDLELQD